MRIPLSLRCAAAFALLPPILSAAQGSPNDEQGQFPPLDGAIASWREQHGAEWRASTDWTTGRVEMLYGGRAAAPFRAASDEDWARLAREFVGSTQDLHGISPASLVHDRTVYLPLGQAGGVDKMTVRFRQVVGGVPVVGGAVNVLMNAMTGELLSVQSTGVPGLAGAATTPGFNPSFASVAAEQRFAEDTGLPPTSVGAAELVFVQVEQAGLRRAVLAWQLDLRWEDEGSEPEAWRYWLDAQTGAVVKTEDQVHHFDVGGTVRSLVTTTTAPDSGGNPPQQRPMPYLDVSSSAGTVTTDVNGNFNFPGVNGPLSCTFTYEGNFADSTNDAGTDYSLVVSLSGTSNQVLMNPGPSATITAQGNAYYEIAALRDWIRSVIPSDGTADFQALSNANLAQTCNAYFDGGSVNFFAAGGGCVNTAYSTVVAHEMGHWLNVLYGTGNGSDGIGEGNADVFAMYLYDDPIVGFNFCGSGCHIRNGNNTRQFCGDSNPGCHGGVHANGEVWMGAAWKVRRNLNITHGNSTGDAIADLIFMSWMNAYDQTQIRSIMETQWLTLDDVDGNIGNGTPNYGDIDSAFREQGFPGFDLDDIFISDVTELPDTQNELGPYVVQATITANVSPPLTATTLFYRVGGGPFVQVPMTNVSGSLYQAAIPGQQSPTAVEYYVQARDSGNVTETFPPDAPVGLIRFRIGVLTVFLFNDFEGATNEGWTVGGPGDDATTGTWERVDPIGTDAQPGDDTTPAPGVICWVTGQTTGGNGGNDVDGGQTTLLSPVFDATGLADAVVTYNRWYSNDVGASPSTDVFVVGISNDGGATWATVETVGPAGPQASGGWFTHSFRIGDILIPTANMRMRFIASDEGSGSIVEAAIDDIVGESLEPVGGFDCNNNGVPDDQDISNGTSQDCNANAIPDECDTASGFSQDCNANSIPDECEPDCNGNGTPDSCDISGGASDDANGNGVPDECECTGGSYCEGLPNSVGFGGFMNFSGSLSVGLNNTVLTAEFVPTGQVGIFYYGTGQTSVPFGNGLRCVSGSTYRLPITTIGAGGTATWALDVTAPPQAGGLIESGDTWNFQFWYRDPAAGGANFNLTDALSLTFCD